MTAAVGGFIPSDSRWTFGKRVRKAAQRYAVKGWKVLPIFMPDPGTGVCSCGDPDCSRPAKHPRTSNGLKDATDDSKKIARMFARDCNVGVRTGEGVMVLDIDPGKDGELSLAALEDEYGPLPDTLTCITGSGGSHFYFKVERPIPCSVGKLGAGLDVRGDGGYVVAPPSMHMSGQEYTWDIGQPFQLAKAPDWLISLCTTKREYRPDDLSERPAGVIEGGRNTYLASQAGLMRRRGMTEKALLAALMAENEERCIPPLSEEEVRKIAKSISRYKPEDDPSDWGNLLVLNKTTGTAKTTAGNAAVYLAYRPEWQGVLAYNEFIDLVYWSGTPPEGFMSPKKDEPFKDEHVVYVQHWLGKNCGPSFSLDHTYAAVQAVAKRNTIHPVKDYLESLRWDGTERLEKWLNVYTGAPDNQITRCIGKWWMISAVARIYAPGCQADHILVLEGPQGVGKSSIVRVLGGEWYMGSMPRVDDKYAPLQLQGSWMIEIPELDSMKGAMRSKTKDFVSQPKDTYRKPYEKVRTERKRQCVFIGTTNEYAYLDDAENRRFWPVRVGRIQLDLLKKDRNQLLAEAVELYKNGEKWYPNADVTPALALEQQDRNIADAWEERVANFLMGREWVTVRDVMFQLGFTDLSQIERRHQMRAGDVLRRMGWVPARRSIKGMRERGFVPTPQWKTYITGELNEANYRKRGGDF